MKILITTLNEVDIPALWVIENAAMTLKEAPFLIKDVGYDSYKAGLLAKDVLVARDDNDEILGSLVFSPAGRLSVQKHHWQFGMSVAPKAQGKGVGRLLIEALLRQGKPAGIKKISMRVMGTNPNAIAFYKHLGFTEEAHYRLEFWIDGEWVDDYQFAYYYDV
ncbi:GNAT family N-acetyltransferase [Listeria grayi]|uniref:Acetyltransferase, GNAT family protein n=1 Tax=Listeria grayi FSL F6-1183 TaxID=1265827 RepID=A0A829R4N8_LISGR|nr:GNAT family N-acetyltransferase [Listeria grayi]EUJ25800.1 acetyltransferase, GNAT family protein [Listeria grayi FSL F6-1183]